MVLYLISLASQVTIETILRFAWNNLPLFLLLHGYLRFYPYLWMLRCHSKPSYARFPSFHVPVDCSVPLPANCLVFSAIRISPTHAHLFGLARWRPWRHPFFRVIHPYNMILAFYFWLWLFKERFLKTLLSPPAHVMSDGVRTFCVTPRSYYYVIRDSSRRLRIRRPASFAKLPIFQLQKRLFKVCFTAYCTSLLRTSYWACPSAFACAFQSEQGDHEPRPIDFDSNCFDVLADNCANFSISFNKEDFTNLEDFQGIVQGVGNCKVKGQGTLHWRFRDDSGRLIDIFDDQALYVPDMQHRILSITHWGQQRSSKREDEMQDHTHMITDADSDTSTLFVDRCKSETTVTHQNRLPRLRCWSPRQAAFPAFSADKCYECYNAISQPENTVSKRSLFYNGKQPMAFLASSLKPKDGTTVSHRKVRFNQDKNATKSIPSAAKPATLSAKEQLMAAHIRFGHTPFGILVQAARNGILPKSIITDDYPSCPSCVYGKASRRAWRTAKSQGKIAPNATRPGDVVSVDQMDATIPGFVAQAKGRLTRKRYKTATIFVDHVSRLSYVHVHHSTGAAEAIEAKKCFEECAQVHGVTVRHYHADNGIFNSKEFKQAVRESQQTISFCGVGAHHQAGVAEHRIRDLSELARTQLLHAQNHNPKAVTPHLWPCALRHASYLYNLFPRGGKALSPIEIFSSSRAQPNLKHAHPFGCPVCVLEEALQTQGGSSPKRWNPRCRVGVYLGASPHHAASVGMILNQQTGCVSPQFHCAYDDLFETPKLDPQNNDTWQKLASFDTREGTHNPDPKFFPDFEKQTEAPEGGLDPNSGPTTRGKLRKRKTHNKKKRKQQQKTHREMVPVFSGPNRTTEHMDPIVEDEEDEDDDGEQFLRRMSDYLDDDSDEEPSPISSNSASETQANEGDAPPNEGDTPPTDEDEGDQEVQDTPDSPDDNDNQDQDSDSQQGEDAPDDEPTDRATEMREWTKSSSVGTHNIISGKRKRSTRTLLNPSFGGKTYYASFLTEVRDAIVFAATEADPDTMTLKQALKEPDADQFLLAMEKEVNDHVTRKHWQLVSNEEMRSSGYKGKPIMCVWSMKRKRNPLGEIVKYKARLCAHGGQTIQGVHYTSTHAPVVTWTTIRFLLILSLVHKWHTRQIDFVLAHPQAKVSHDLFMHIPERFKVLNNQLSLDKDATNPFKADHKLKLLQNLCGLKDAGATWFEHLRAGLLKRDFVQSQVDPCLFYKKDLILIIYVDDCIIMTPKPELVDEFIASMKTEYKLEDEGDINAYLGINVTRPAQGKIKLNQPALIRRIIDSLGLKDDRKHKTPADVVLNKDIDGQDRKLDFNFRSLVGQLNYLTSSTRPDTQVATHQCARYCNNPKLSHEQALKRIVRYLKQTADEGIILEPDLSKGFECYVDADFAGGFKDSDPTDPQSCLSRTGYVIMCANCPILWSSKMQTTIALSTTEAECVALSTALRDVIFLMELVKEFEKYGAPIPKSDSPTVHCRVFEDNVGALELATQHKLRPRTKHIAAQYHHFRHCVQTNQIKIQHIKTNDQIADIFTKPLPRPTFEYLRKLLLKW